jgi:hypothetical protein
MGAGRVAVYPLSLSRSPWMVLFKGPLSPTSHDLTSRSKPALQTLTTGLSTPSTERARRRWRVQASTGACPSAFSGGESHTPLIRARGVSHTNRRVTDPVRHYAFIALDPRIYAHTIHTLALALCNTHVVRPSTDHRSASLALTCTLHLASQLSPTWQHLSHSHSLTHSDLVLLLPICRHHLLVRGRGHLLSTARASTEMVCPSRARLFSPSSESQNRLINPACRRRFRFRCRFSILVNCSSWVANVRSLSNMTVTFSSDSQMFYQLAEFGFGFGTSYKL